MEWGETSGGFCKCPIGIEGLEEHVMLVGLVLPYHPMEHGLDDFVDNFNLSISLGIV